MQIVYPNIVMKIVNATKPIDFAFYFVCQTSPGIYFCLKPGAKHAVLGKNEHMPRSGNR